MNPLQKELDYGASGTDIVNLQNFLISKGYDIPAGSTGNFLFQTQNALRQYQLDRELITPEQAKNPAYIRVGPKTLQSINSEIETEKNSSPVPSTGTPYFMGNEALIRFTGTGPRGYMDSDTIWLVDAKTKTIRPFESMQAVKAVYGNIDINKIIPVSADILNPGGMFGLKDNDNGFQVLSNDFIIKNDGTTRKMDFSSSELMNRYGNAINKDIEQQSYIALNGFLNLLTNTDSGIEKHIINKTKADLERGEEIGSFYLNALTYGGYNLLDVYRDMKAKQEELNELKPISVSIPKSEYIKTNDYISVNSDTRLIPPSQIGNMSASDLNLAVYQMPDNAFKTLVPVLDFDSPEFKQKMDNIESAYHDILLESVNAKTESEKNVADENWKQFREDLENEFGIQLSNNVFEAFDQIQKARSSFSGRGLSGSGMEQESIADYLTRVRKQDRITREKKVREEEKEDMNYYRSFATPEQVKDLFSTDIETAKRYGLVPSDEVKKAFSLDTLKAKYPNTPVEDLQRYIATTLDQYGNYRSDLFQKRLQAEHTILYDPEKGKERYQQEQVQAKILREEEKSYKPYTTPDVPFLRSESEGFLNVSPPQSPVVTTERLAERQNIPQFSVINPLAPSIPKQSIVKPIKIQPKSSIPIISVKAPVKTPEKKSIPLKLNNFNLVPTQTPYKSPALTITGTLPKTSFQSTVQTKTPTNLFSNLGSAVSSLTSSITSKAKSLLGRFF